MAVALNRQRLHLISLDAARPGEGGGGEGRPAPADGTPAVCSPGRARRAARQQVRGTHSLWPFTTNSNMRFQSFI